MGKFEKHSGKKSLALLLVLMMLLGCAVGGTIAWLTTQTTPVVNTFVAGQIGDLSLVETDTTSKLDDSYLVIPGADITKDPKVTYNPAENANVAAYVFVKVEAVNGSKWEYNETSKQYEITATIDSETVTALSFEIDDGWTPVTGYDDVYYKTVGVGEKLDGVSVIKDNTVVVSEKITAGAISDIVTSANSIQFTAYAIQQSDKLTVVQAWETFIPET